MDVTTLAAEALALIIPFLSKTGEGVARKVGEDVWTLIKSPFVKRGVVIEPESTLNNTEAFQDFLVSELDQNEQFRNDLLEKVNSSKQLLNESFQQNIISNEKVEKQINIQINHGKIKM